MAADQKLVVHFKDNRVLKGTSPEFSPNRDSFYLTLISRSSTNQPIKISFEDLKGVFFVKDFMGRTGYQVDSGLSMPGKTFYGQRTVVHFKDGEILYGFIQEYLPARLGFFLYPYDSQSNNLKLFVIHSSVAKVEFPPPTNYSALKKKNTRE